MSHICPKCSKTFEELFDRKPLSAGESMIADRILKDRKEMKPLGEDNYGLIMTFPDGRRTYKVFECPECGYSELWRIKGE